MKEPSINSDDLAHKVFSAVSMPPMRDLPYKVESLHALNPREQIEQIIEAHSAVHGETTVDHLLTFLEHQKALNVVAAKDGERSIGYMIGYQLTPVKYLNWMVGVHPEYRRQGIATALLHTLQSWVADKGYTTLRTESSNLWRAMLILNIRFGFRVVGTCLQGVPGDEPKIIFEKELSLIAAK